MARGTTVKLSINEEAALRQVLINDLARLMPKGEWGVYSLDLIKSLYLQHIGPLPDPDAKEEVKEITKV